MISTPSSSGLLKLPTGHLQRLVIVYIRQSSGKQVRQNQESQFDNPAWSTALRPWVGTGTACTFWMGIQASPGPQPTDEMTSKHWPPKSPWATWASFSAGKSLVWPATTLIGITSLTWRPSSVH